MTTGDNNSGFIKMADSQASLPDATKAAPAIPFANDGSFLAKFKAMQQAKAMSASIAKAKADKKEAAKDKTALPFANDGGFMEQFKAMQKAKAPAPPSTEPTEATSAPTPADSEQSKQPTAKRDAIRVRPSSRYCRVVSHDATSVSSSCPSHLLTR
jgi:hypothetical protein